MSRRERVFIAIAVGLLVILAASASAAMKIEFTVFGEPKTAGSKKAFYNPKLKRAFITDANAKSRDWKEQVASAARQAYSGDLMRETLAMRLIFYRVRPRGHYKKDGTFTKSGQESTAPATRPDLLKLARAVEDALKGVTYVDDSQIVDETLRKVWGEPARVEVSINTFNGQAISLESAAVWASTMAMA